MKKPSLRRPARTSYIGAYVEDSMKDSVVRLAVTEDVSVGRIVREAITQYLDRKNQAQAA
jgi:predicted transcriptional regulator